MGLGARIGAGLAATGAAVGGTVAPLANENDYNPTLTHDIPAHYQGMDYQDPMAQYQIDGNNINYSPESQTATLQEPVESAEESKPNNMKQIGEVGECMGDMADAHAEGLKRKDENDESEEQNNALRGPGYGKKEHPFLRIRTPSQAGKQRRKSLPAQKTPIMNMIIIMIMIMIMIIIMVIISADVGQPDANP